MPLFWVEGGIFHLPSTKGTSTPTTDWQERGSQLLAFVDKDSITQIDTKDLSENDDTRRNSGGTPQKGLRSPHEGKRPVGRTEATASPLHLRQETTGYKSLTNQPEGNGRGEFHGGTRIPNATTAYTQPSITRLKDSEKPAA